MSTQDSTEVCTSEKILRLRSRGANQAFYFMELSGEIRDRVQAGKLKLIELRAAVVSQGCPFI